MTYSKHPRDFKNPGDAAVRCNNERVLHIFCNIELMPGELERWNIGGYKIARAIPFDMFPGTAEIEMMVLLKPTSVSTQES